MLSGWVVVAALGLPASGGEPLAVLPVAIRAPVASPEDASTLLTSMLTDALAQVGRYDVLSADDVASLLGHESDLQALGCTDAACYSEVADALGARLAVLSEVTRAGDQLTWSLRTVDQRTGDVTASASTRGARVDELVAQVTELAMVLSGDAEAIELKGKTARRRLGFAHERDLAAFAAERTAHKDWPLRQALTSFVIGHNVESRLLDVAGTVALVGAALGAGGAAAAAGGALAAVVMAGAFTPFLIVAAVVLGAGAMAAALAGAVLVAVDQRDGGHVEVRADGCCRDDMAIRHAASGAGSGRAGAALATAAALALLVTGPFLPVLGAFGVYIGFLALSSFALPLRLMQPAGAGEDFGISPVVFLLGAGGVILLLASPPMVLTTGIVAAVVGVVALVRGDPPVLVAAEGRE